jgi:hypothetical protein
MDKYSPLLLAKYSPLLLACFPRFVERTLFGIEKLELFFGEKLTEELVEQKSDLILEINNYTGNLTGELLEHKDEISQISKSILNVLIGLNVKDVKSFGDFIKRIYEIIKHNRYIRIFFCSLFLSETQM